MSTCYFWPKIFIAMACTISGPVFNLFELWCGFMEAILPIFGFVYRGARFNDLFSIQSHPHFHYDSCKENLAICERDHGRLKWST